MSLTHPNATSEYERCHFKRGTVKSKRYVVLAVIFVLGLIAPYLLTTSWHILHAGQLSYQGVIIYVPRRWMPTPKAWNNTPAPELMKLPVTVFSTHLVGHIQLGPDYSHFKGTPDNLQSWRRATESLYGPRGYVVNGPTQVEGRENSYCIVALPREKDGKTMANCYLREGAWSASFVGQSSDVGEFMKTVREIH